MQWQRERERKLVFLVIKFSFTKNALQISNQCCANNEKHWTTRVFSWRKKPYHILHRRHHLCQFVAGPYANVWTTKTERARNALSRNYSYGNTNYSLSNPVKSINQKYPLTLDFFPTPFSFPWYSVEYLWFFICQFLQF